MVTRIPSVTALEFAILPSGVQKANFVMLYSFNLSALY